MQFHLKTLLSGSLLILPHTFSFCNLATYISSSHSPCPPWDLSDNWNLWKEHHVPGLAKHDAGLEERSCEKNCCWCSLSMWPSHCQYTSTTGKRHTLTFCKSNVTAEPVSALLCKSTNQRGFYFNNLVCVDSKGNTSDAELWLDSREVSCFSPEMDCQGLYLNFED